MLTDTCNEIGKRERGIYGYLSLYPKNVLAAVLRGASLWDGGGESAPNGVRRHERNLRIGFKLFDI